MSSLAPIITTRRLVTALCIVLVIGATFGYAIRRLHDQDQRHVPVEAMTRAVNKYVTGIDTTPRGVRYRWVPGGVAVTVPAPFAPSIVTFDSWFWPDTTAHTIQLNQTTLTIPVDQAYIPRRYQVLALGSTWDSTATVTISVAGEKAFWAFTGMQAQPASSVPHVSLLILALAVICVVGVLVWRWYPSVLWATIVGHCVLLVWMLQTTPVAQYVPATLARQDRWLLVAGIVITVLMLGAIPLARAWFADATPAQRVTLLTTSIICVAPMVALLYGPEPLEQRVTENRRLTAFPRTFPSSMVALAEAATTTEQWLSDHYGWRSLLIRTKNELAYRVFGTSSRVYFGSDDVIYMRRWSDERFPDLDAVLNDPVRRGALFARMRARVDMYRGMGIVPIVVITPSKEVIYPEYLPWYVAPYDTTALRGFIADLRAAGVTVIDGEAVLLSHKASTPLLFHKQDFHWNRVAAHLVADAVMTKAAQSIPAQRSWQRPVEIISAPSPFADRDFAGLLLDRYAVPAGYDIAMELPPTGEWSNQMVMGNAMDIWHNSDPQVAFPDVNLQIVGDSFSIRFINAGFEHGFPAIYRSFYPVDDTQYPAWLREQRIGVVVWQLRDAGLTYFLDDIAEQ
ncbi:MAG: hypothetical protein RLY87_2494 [Chloroflexota bacterium]